MSGEVYREELLGDSGASKSDALVEERPAQASSNAPALRIDILSLFPEMFAGPFDHSMIARAQEAGLVDIRIHNLRDWTKDRHRTSDDYAFGGGGGMVLKPEPAFAAVEEILAIAPLAADGPGPPHPVILLTPQGTRFDHAMATDFAGHERIVLLCGHYEGFDERIRAHLATHEVSVGDFVLTGGELPAMIVADAVARLRPGVVGLETATQTDSFATGMLEHPHYTRPAEFRDWAVPDVLRSGDHGKVARWRRDRALERTFQRRPDLLEHLELDAQDRSFLLSLGWAENAP